VSVVQLATTAHLGRGDLEMSCGLFLNVKCVGVTWGISPNVYHIYLSSSAGTLTTIA
jgi:hypothetical protein